VKYSHYILVLFAFLGLTACDGRDQVATKTEPPRLVKVMTISALSSGVYHTYPARVKASKQVDLSFEVPGRLIELPATEGMEVKKGELLAKLNPSDYQNALNSEIAKYNHAKTMYLRYKYLLQSSTVSKADYDEKYAQYKVMEANKAVAEKALNDTELHAPFDGFVATRFVDNYEYVNAQQKIISVQDFSSVEVILQVPEQDVTRNPSKRDANKHELPHVFGEVQFAAIPGKTFEAKLTEFSTEADPTTQTYKATLLVKKSNDLKILPGMTASVRLKFIDESKNMFSIPVSAVSINPEGNYFVWIVDSNNIVHKKNISVGEMTQDDIEVTKGLQIGDTIVLAGVAYLEDNMPVRILKGKIGK